MNFNKKWLPWKLAHFRLGTISENVCNSDCYHHAKFHACIKMCTICLKFRVMLPDYREISIVNMVKSYKVCFSFVLDYLDDGKIKKIE